MIGPKVLTARWLLLCALAFGVVGMHHLASLCHHDDEVTLVAMSSRTPTIAALTTGRDPGLVGRASTATGTRPRSGWRSPS
jgi:hypothetical protein